MYTFYSPKRLSPGPLVRSRRRIQRWGWCHIMYVFPYYQPNAFRFKEQGENLELRATRYSILERERDSPL